ncbi:hypothetical protein EON77_01835 [bacterium]|nr:MAG: hypothetical protein EON77_01835 [bacterium]
MDPILASLRKEWRQESRSLSGLAVTASFALGGSLLTLVALYGTRGDAQLIGGLIWLVLLFAAGVTLPRTFLIEDETGTADLLRLISPAGPVFWGKAILASAQMLVIALLAAGPILLQSELKVVNPLLLVVALTLGAIGVGATATLCGALASGAANRGAVAAGLALPLLIFLASMGTTALLPALGDSRSIGWSACLGLFGWVTGVFTIGPPILAAIWRR